MKSIAKPNKGKVARINPRFPENTAKRVKQTSALRGQSVAAFILEVASLKEAKNGGQGGIRTHGDIAATHAFQACSFDHSDTCPLAHGGGRRELAMRGWMCNTFFSGFRVAAGGPGGYGCVAMTRTSIEVAIKIFLAALVLTFLWTCWQTLLLLGVI